MRRTCLASIVCALACAAPASAATLHVEGRGFGHGIGMSQWGTYGYVTKAGRHYNWILAHYYPGTKRERVGSRTVRVLLKSSSSQKVCGADTAVGGGRKVRLRSTRAYRVYMSGGTLRLYDTSARRTKTRLQAPVRISGGSSVCLRGKAENGVSDGNYRGDILLSPNGSKLDAINRVPVERYLYGVVPAEMPSSWPREALKVQAVAARSYALRSLKPGARYDVFADVRSQVYRGVAGEAASSTAAVGATRGMVLTYGGQIAHTYFFSTSGGQTANIEDEWDAAPIPYLRSVPDDYDYVSPVHTWSLDVPFSKAESALGDLVRGNLEDVRVVDRNASSRAHTVEVVGSKGSRTTTAAVVRTRLGLRSTWFYLSKR
jgi:stage II sporulation protein D